jgi:hypothetical protein
VVTAADTVYVSDVNVGVVNIVKDGKRIDSVSADRVQALEWILRGGSTSRAPHG